MTSSSESASAVLGLFLFLQLVGFLALLLGGFYLLSCLQRAANGLDRLASVAEAWLQHQTTQSAPPVAPTYPATPAYPAATPYPVAPVLHDVPAPPAPGSTSN